MHQWYRVLLLSISCLLSWNVTASSLSKVQTLDGELSLNLSGIGIYKKHKKPIYLGALYQKSLEQTEASLFREKNAKRMDLRIIEDNLSAKRFARELAHHIRMNNDKEFIGVQEGNVANFLRSFQGKFKRGDQILIEYNPDEGTVFVLNGKVLGRVIDPRFFSVLLNAWIGPKPPTEKFKRGILGQSTDQEAIALQKEYSYLVQLL